MKKIITLLSLLTIALFFFTPVQSFAQSTDTLWIAALPAGNINTVINSDTTSTGIRKHLYYGLHRGSYYYFTSTIIVNGNFTLVGENPTSTIPPAVIAPAILADGSSPDTYFSFIGHDVTVKLKNLYLLNVRPDRQLGNSWATQVLLKGDRISLNIDKVIFEGAVNCISSSGNYDKYFVYNSKFKNNQHATSWFGGSPIIATGVALDTVKIVNNTFYCNNSYVFCTTDYEKYTLIEHNTIFMTAVNPLNMFSSFHAIIRNNIFYGTEAEGQTKNEQMNYYFDDRIDQNTSSVISFDTTKIRNGLLVKNLDPKNRFIQVNNNAYFWPKALTDFYKAYNDTVKQTCDYYGVQVKATLAPSNWINGFTDTLFHHHTPAYSNLNESNNLNVDPGFNSSVTNMVTPLINYVLETRNNKLVNGATYWLYYPAGSTTNPNNPFQALFPPAWPLTENFAYSNVALQTAGTDGKALGDLNWFPNQLVTGVTKTDSEIPTNYTLQQNYPNPFNPTTTISFSIPSTARVTLKVYDMIGREIATLVNEEKTAGTYKVNFNASRLASGVYLYTLNAGTFSNTRKLIVLK